MAWSSEFKLGHSVTQAARYTNSFGDTIPKERTIEQWFMKLKCGNIVLEIALGLKFLQMNS